MDRVFSTRLDERTIDDLKRITKRLGLTKKRFLEEAIRLRAASADEREAGDVWADTSGAWQRRESPRTTISRARRAFEQSVHRHHRRQKAS